LAISSADATSDLNGCLTIGLRLRFACSGTLPLSSAAREYRMVKAVLHKHDYGYDAKESCMYSLYSTIEYNTI